MDLGGVVRTVGLDHGLPRLPASGGLLCRQDELRDKNRETDRNGAGKAFFLRPVTTVGVICRSHFGKKKIGDYVEG
jgi:hypothetical protein